MLTKEQSIFVVTQMSKLQSPALVKNEFERIFKTVPNIPSESLIIDIFKNFMETGSILECSKEAPLTNVTNKLMKSQLGSIDRLLKKQNSQDKLIDVSEEDMELANNRRSSIASTGVTSNRKSSIISIGAMSSRRSSVASTGVTSSRRASFAQQEEAQFPISLYEMVGKDLTVDMYFLRLSQHLTPEDCDARLQMCEELKDFIQEDPSIVGNILFSSEASFHMSGHVTKHNCTIWGSEYPPSLGARESSAVTVWCGIGKDQVYGPHFFNDSVVTEESYTNMLRTFLIPLLRRRNQMGTVIFQNDGGSGHLGAMTKSFLDEKFPKRWLGRRGLVKWAPRSPDISPVDFYFWGEVKAQVYRIKPKTVTELQSKITTAINAVSVQSLEASFQAWEQRISQCLESQGRLITE